MSDESPLEPPFNPQRFARAAMRTPVNHYRLAENGDKLAAEEAIRSLLMALAMTKATNPATDQPLPLKSDACDYLEKALVKILNGVDANRAFNLKKSGRAKWTYREKWNIAQLVYQFVNQGHTVENSVNWSMELIERVTSKDSQFSDDVIDHEFSWKKNRHPYHIYKEREVGFEQIYAWYFELKADLEEVDRITRTGQFP